MDKEKKNENKEKEEIVQQKKAQILVAENDISHAKKDIEKMILGQKLLSLVKNHLIIYKIL